MSLDYTWSYDQIFPSDIYKNPKVEALLSMAGLEANHRGNHVMSFHDPDTTLALLNAPGEVVGKVISEGFSLAPHTLAQPGDHLGSRIEFLIDNLGEVQAKLDAGEIDKEEAKARVWLTHMFLSNDIMRKVVRDPETDKLVPDPEFIAAASGKAKASFDLKAYQAAVEAGPAYLLSRGAKAPNEATDQGGVSIAATVLLREASEAAEAKNRVIDAGLVEGFKISELSSGSLLAERDDTILAVMTFDAPYPEQDLRQLCAGNALAPNAWEAATPSKGHVHVQMQRRASGLATRDDAMMVARVAAAIGGCAVVWSASKAAVPSADFASAVAQAEGDDWPLPAMLRLTPYQHEGREGVVLTGLTPFTGHELALACGPDEKLSSAAGRLLSLGKWVLDTKPRLADGDTMGTEGSGGAQLRVHDIPGPDGVSTFELRPYDGPPAKHSPEERERDMTQAATESTAKETKAPARPAKRPFWKFWAK